MFEIPTANIKHLFGWLKGLLIDIFNSYNLKNGKVCSDHLYGHTSFYYLILWGISEFMNKSSNALKYINL